MYKKIILIAITIAIVLLFVYKNNQQHETFKYPPTGHDKSMFNTIHNVGQIAYEGHYPMGTGVDLADQLRFKRMGGYDIDTLKSMHPSQLTTDELMAVVEAENLSNGPGLVESVRYRGTMMI